MIPKLALASALALALSTHVLAFDKPEYQTVDPIIRDWFKSVRRPSGALCCDIADGHRTTWRGSKDGGYEVPVEGEWLRVPPDAVIIRPDNPTGEAVVWFGKYAGGLYIRCFVPGGGV
jgi:hypothetical protein